MKTRMRRQTDPEVPQKPREELGRLVEPAEVVRHADVDCRLCWGAGIYFTNHRIGEKDTRVPHVCGCASARFLKVNHARISYIVVEKGIPVRWLKGQEPASENTPDPGAAARP